MKVNIRNGFQLLLCLAVLFLHQGLSAQSLSRQVIGSGGGSILHPNQQIWLHYQIGEAVTETLIRGSFALTEGFEQPDSQYRQGWAGSVSAIRGQGAIRYLLYPNPINQLGHLRIVSPLAVQLHLELASIDGKLFWERDLDLLPGEEQEIDIEVGHLSTGMYFLYFYDPEGREMHGLKWFKM